MADLKPLIAKVAAGTPLTRAEAREAFDEVARACRALTEVRPSAPAPPGAERPPRGDGAFWTV